MVDVAIIGGGPAGSTCASMLLKYNPRLKVVLVEREEFPRDHVGESQLPVISRVLEEMGCWNKVEAANFPIKIGATYRWGRTDQLWDFEFILDGKFVGSARPGKYEGERLQTAFQVDRAVYDKILLDHSRSLGCELRQPVSVRQVLVNGDRVEGLVLDNGEKIVAKHYIDASGHAGILRRAVGVEIEAPTSLQNIAIWDYWQNADWAVSVGVGGTRVQVLSIGYGWIWFIPLSPTRTSMGLIVPASYYKASGKRPEELYAEAVAGDAVVQSLIKNATSEGKLTTTKDWSFLANRLAGENWWLVGESAGFADPILSAGMTLAHVGGRDVAYAILAQERQDYEAEWLRSWYDESNRKKIAQHIRFADFWYSANGLFSDLKEETQRIAKDAGLDMTPDEAWRWLGTGGFVQAEDVGSGHGGYSLGAVKSITGNFLGTGPRYQVEGMNTFQLNLDGATRSWSARMINGKIERHRTYVRGEASLPNAGIYRLLITATKDGATAPELFQIFAGVRDSERMAPDQFSTFLHDAYFSLESMICDGWLTASYDPALPALGIPEGAEKVIHANRDNVSPP